MGTAKTRAVDIIRAEHRSIARVLDAMESAIAGNPGDGRLGVLSSAIYYMRTFPDRLHHPKEEEFLFKVLVDRVPETADAIAALVLEHQESVELLDDLEQRLRGRPTDLPHGWKALVEAVSAYVAFQRRHMGHEEAEILEVAEQRLSAEDLEVIERAFAANIDPLYGDDFAVGYAALARHIRDSARKNAL